jgi:hypothetical protein
MDHSSGYAWRAKRAAEEELENQRRWEPYFIQDGKMYLSAPHPDNLYQKEFPKKTEEQHEEQDKEAVRGTN